MTDERTIQFGVYQASKKKFQEQALRAGALLRELRQITNTLVLKKDFLKINFNECAVLVNDLKNIQSEAKETLEIIENLQTTYNFD